MRVRVCVSLVKLDVRASVEVDMKVCVVQEKRKAWRTIERDTARSLRGCLSLRDPWGLSSEETRL